jgi:hypothetical protein
MQLFWAAPLSDYEPGHDECQLFAGAIHGPPTGQCCEHEDRNAFWYRWRTSVPEVRAAHTAPLNSPNGLHLARGSPRAAREHRLMDQFAPSADEAGSASDQSRVIARRIVDAMQEINAAITAERSFGREFAIGHSFFCKFDSQQRLGPAQWASRVFSQEICPLIDEYCVEHPKLRDKLFSLIPSF